MARVVSIGAQNFATLRENGAFYVDKTGFIRDWWNGLDQVTLVCRPRRFGKTLALSTAECFLSTAYAGRGEELFGGLEVWGDPAMRALQGTAPVIALSFASVKETSFESALAAIKPQLRAAVRTHDYLRESQAIDADGRAFLDRVSDDMDNATATTCLNRLCAMLRDHHGVAPVVLLDEYDTPMQEAWLAGYWGDMAGFMRSLMNATFKTNPALGRALITGITRVSRESIFSDLNNLATVTTTTPAYETAFGFTEEEVFESMDEFGLDDREGVRAWYDGFTFGDVPDVYNPWSITNYLKRRSLGAFWVNTSSNGLVSSLVRRGDVGLKEDFGVLLEGGTVTKKVDEQVSFDQLGDNEGSVWSLLLATGYLRVVRKLPRESEEDKVFPLELTITNREVRAGFNEMVSGWFADGSGSYNAFVRTLLAGDVDAMSDYLGDLASGVMSSFDSAKRPSRTLPERFWHGLVLGLLVELRGRYSVESNRESGYGRCDVMLVPLDGPGGLDPAIILEFKVLDARQGESRLEDAVASALNQIEERRYAAALEERGIAPERIHSYGVAFSGKEVLVG